MIEYLLMQISHRPWSDEDIKTLIAAYARGTAHPVDLTTVAEALGREKANVCRKARGLGLTHQRRPKVEERSPPRTARFTTIEDLRAWQSERMKKHLAEKGHPRGMMGVKQTAESRAKMSVSQRAVWADLASGHHTEQRKQARAEQMRKRVQSGAILTGEHMYSRAKKGRRVDICGQFFRSRWEANYARYLNLLKERGQVTEWGYEVQTFMFEGITRGTMSYTPDFLVFFSDGRREWHEVKGWMDPKSQTRLDRMARYFPEEKIVLIQAAWFRSAKKSGLAQIVPGWETWAGKDH